MTGILEILLLAAAIYLLARSPRKWQTFSRMVVAFVTLLLLSIIGSAFLRIGDPEVWGAAGRLAGLVLAIFVAWRHQQAFSRARSNAPQPSRPNDQPAGSPSQ